MKENASIVFVGLGSNLEEPKAKVCSAINAIEVMRSASLLGRSSLYSSPPMGPPDQPNYINAVVKIKTDLDCLSLLEQLQRIECDHGRIRGDVHWGPRTLDLDILLYGRETIDTKRLKVPHPGIAERAFVLVPLLELEPELALPNGVLLSDLVATISTRNLTRLAYD